MIRLPGTGTLAPLLLTLSLAACNTGGLGASKDTPFAPDVDARGTAVDPLLVGHRLMEAGEFELALKSYTRAAGQQGFTADVLASLATANIGLGRLGQAETQLRQAIKVNETRPEIWNNLGVVLIEQGETAEAAQIFRKAYAMDNGQSDSVRDNLRLALAKLENSAYDGEQLDQEFKLVRLGNGGYLLTGTP
ncbi:tetratricopeptide repeat protein [Cognatishimia sp.]|uniref:tetratricopeptide repeat protein n=1 Tax=Cognatishimia sp. TaxID=2211648 RepID=UPI0035171C26